MVRTMLSKYIKSLKEIRKRAVSAKTLNSYVAALSDIFISDMQLFTKTCEDFGITEDELLEMLNNPSISNITLFDEILHANVTNIKNGEERFVKISR